MVSIILPVHNGEQYLKQAISSVLEQQYKDWELLIVNDGSTDGTGRILNEIHDSRIKIYHVDHQGVSHARNVALGEMSGDFFCFLDADDRLPPDSIQSRLHLFDDKSTDFVDGQIIEMNQEFTSEIGTWTPEFSGEPYQDLTNLNCQSFYGITWMIRRRNTITYSFDQKLSQAEDLDFFMTCAEQGGRYRFVTSPVYHVRKRTSSNRRNIHQLLAGYQHIYSKLKEKDVDTSLFRVKTRRIMIRSLLKRGKIASCFKILIGNWPE